MSPEQASCGELAIDRRSDVYQIGLLLFEMLTGKLPYPIHMLGLPSRLRAIRFMQPDRLGKHVPRLAGDLELVVARALEKEPERRYASARELADDLRAWCAGRPVTARPPNLTTRTRRFVARRPLASSLFATGAAALFGISLLFSQAVRARDLARENAEEAELAAAEARARQEEMERERANLLRLADARRLQELLRREEELWPAAPDRVAEMDAWLLEGAELVTHLEEHEASLEALRAGPRATPAAAAEATAAEVWWGDALEELVEGLRAFSQPDEGRLDRVRERRALASELERVSILDEADAWTEAIASAAADERYAEVDLTPQLGLVPLGTDPDSGLLEFWHVASGARPERDPTTGVNRVAEETGLVLVLLPGGAFLRGAQASDPDAPHYDPGALTEEGPVRELTLSPFFLSKYEMTQGQWLRATGVNPAFHVAGDDWGGQVLGLANPVERVSWQDAMTWTARLDLAVCTEAQWEYGARAGGGSIYVCGDDPGCLVDVANVADQECANHGPTDWEYESWDDGYYVHSPVGAYAPNAFGLYDVSGNVREHCRDHYSREGFEKIGSEDPWVNQENLSLRTIRGSDFSQAADWSRMTNRYPLAPRSFDPYTGLRPSRPLRSRDG